jgi:hypothetical protein
MITDIIWLSVGAVLGLMIGVNLGYNKCKGERKDEAMAKKQTT